MSKKVIIAASISGAGALGVGGVVALVAKKSKKIAPSLTAAKLRKGKVKDAYNNEPLFV